MLLANGLFQDKYMQLNQGRFLANGGCGYVLKPEFMLQENYDPSKPQALANPNPVILTIEIIAGRHLSRKEKGKGIASPVVDIEVIGLPCDTRAYRTATVCK
ncbi:unnamed protein product [Soboliphyme baturini]|uniref:PI-PLC Y-box domain-containing protein n=1 Tax=Soboliphyme baturini TaxID=241478 RepID=A0A183J9X0_9BILA|nr:unnamed protein product [Soboliphyme baturini]